MWSHGRGSGRVGRAPHTVRPSGGRDVLPDTTTQAASVTKRSVTSAPAYVPPVVLPTSDHATHLLDRVTDLLAETVFFYATAKADVPLDDGHRIYRTKTYKLCGPVKAIDAKPYMTWNYINPETAEVVKHSVCVSNFFNFRDIP